MKEEWKVYIKGVPNRGDEVIKALTKLGGKKGECFKGDNDDYIYFINHKGNISSASLNSEPAKIIMDNYHELHLPEKWKDGDIIYSPKFGTFAVYGYNNPTTVYCRVSKNDLVPYPTRAMKYDYRLATPQEIEQFHEALHKYRKDWDAEKKQLTKYRWKPGMGEMYWVVSANSNIVPYKWDNDSIDNNYFDFGNCFKTKEEAEAMAEKIKKLLKGEQL